MNDPTTKVNKLKSEWQQQLSPDEYAVTRDGQRFLINQPAGGPAAYAIWVVLNWRDLLTSTGR